MIYIDPPYNTGNKFIYNDKFTKSEWLNFMYPRLFLARQLLRDDGVIFVSIDDNEVHHLRMIMDEIFGEENFLTTVCVKMSHLSGMKMSHKEKKIPKIKEFLHIYAIQSSNVTINPIYIPGKWDDVLDRYSYYIENPDDPIDSWKYINVNTKMKLLGIKDDNEKEKFRIANANRIFRTAVNDSLSGFPKDNIFREVLTATGLRKLVLNGEEVIFATSRMVDFDGELLPAETIGDIWTDIGINNMHNEGGIAFQNGKKPVKLIHRLVKMFSNQSSIILDFFAGSGTTGHAVWDLNKEDGGNRKFILVQIDE